MRNILVGSAIAIAGLISSGCVVQTGLPYGSQDSKQQPSAYDMKFRTANGFEIVPSSAIRSVDVNIYSLEHRNYVKDAAVSHMATLNLANPTTGHVPSGAVQGTVEIQFDSAGFVDVRNFNIYSDQKGQYLEDMNYQGVQYVANAPLDLNWLDH